MIEALPQTRNWWSERAQAIEVVVRSPHAVVARASPPYVAS